MTERSERYPGLDDRDRKSSDRRPQPYKQKNASGGGYQPWKVWGECGTFKDMRGAEIEQKRAGQRALKQKTGTGPAFGECGKQTLQNVLPVLAPC
jgi:hypothetical protein